MVAATIVSAAYIAFQMMADIASLRIVMIAGFSVDAGTFVYPFTFTLRDLVHKTAGIKAARALIVTAAVLNLLMAGLFWLTSILPADMVIGPQKEFGMVLSPVWRIVFASIVAEVVAEMIDTEGYRLWIEKVTTKYQWARVLVSNSLSIPIDSLIFVWIAFGGLMPSAVVWSIFLSNVIIKGLTTIISLPGIYLVKEKAVE
jgi:queuosine precursor transporter